ncbi:hypothetical protein [Nocardioides sp. CFH 31398]|uniref:hypothetical protein n=1 Tax=Nocardioides sp. CFH 31398 TaxID=2919579 RepID=UPI001F058AA8|nr:hypothetical protein [Nocardioides sp. CFH 31398]MCH1867197.1 hypothetical protein [Nocardioides sp. CFH 31398]
MDLPADLTLVDLLVVAVVVLAFAGALRRGGGVLAGAGAAVAALVVAWVAVAATATWGPGPTDRVARDTALLDVAPVPARAQREAEDLVDSASR